MIKSARNGVWRGNWGNVEVRGCHRTVVGRRITRDLDLTLFRGFWSDTSLSYLLKCSCQQICGTIPVWCNLLRCKFIVSTNSSSRISKVKLRKVEKGERCGINGLCSLSSRVATSRSWHTAYRTVGLFRSYFGLSLEVDYLPTVLYDCNNLIKLLPPLVFLVAGSFAETEVSLSTDCNFNPVKLL